MVDSSSRPLILNSLTKNYASHAYTYISIAEFGIGWGRIPGFGELLKNDIVVLDIVARSKFSFLSLVYLYLINHTH